MHNTETITDRIVLVMLGISIWSGRKKLKPEDLNLLDGEIPPEELVSLGSKRVCDPEPLKPFHRLKQSAERACLRVGTRFLGADAAGGVRGGACVAVRRRGRCRPGGLAITHHWASRTLAYGYLAHEAAHARSPPLPPPRAARRARYCSPSPTAFRTTSAAPWRWCSRPRLPASRRSVSVSVSVSEKSQPNLRRAAPLHPRRASLARNVIIA